MGHPGGDRRGRQFARADHPVAQRVPGPGLQVHERWDATAGIGLRPEPSRHRIGRVGRPDHVMSTLGRRSQFLVLGERP
jgi:hypothetical protein